jgi:BTB/POZ domain-containing protein KCTD9
MSASLVAYAADKIILHVGERRFVTTAKTLTTQSGFFSALLSGRWDNVQIDGSYFVDVDGDVFEYILRYLRSDVLPIFYEKSKGPDHRLYVLLLQQATYFQIRRLEKWIRDKTYLRAITVTQTLVEKSFTDFDAEKTAMDLEIEYHASYKTEKVYICPRGISSHRGNPNHCGRACANAGKDQELEYEDENVWSVLMIQKKTEFNQQICLEEAEPRLAYDNSNEDVADLV